MSRARALLFVMPALFAPPGVLADSGLLGICSDVSSASCGTSTNWSVQEAASPAQLTNPSGAGVDFQIIVSEGATRSTLALQDLVSLDGLFESGTTISAIYLSVQKGDGAGHFTTVASAAIGDTSQPCSCPYVQSAMTLTAHDATGTALTSSPLLALAYGSQATVSLDLNWDLSQGLVSPGDSLRVQPCVTYQQAGLSLPAGCFADGGGTRSIRACSGFSLPSCQLEPSTLTESIAALSSPIASTSSFTATTSSLSLGPPGISQQAGGSAVSLTATPSGTVGTQSFIDVRGQLACNGSAGAATLSGSSQLAGSSATASLALSCLAAGWSCGSLGAAAPYNLFAINGVNASDSDIEGALAAGGSVALSGYSVGANLPANATALVAGGNLNLTQGWIDGDAWVGGTASLSAAGLSGALHAHSTLIDFAGASSSLQSLSSQLAALPARGQVLANGDGSLTLSGSDPALDLFDVTGSALANSWGVSFQVPAHAFAVVNVSGASAQMVNQSFNPGTLGPQQLILNFPGATALNLSGVGLSGTLLAPLAAASFNNGQLDGALVAGSFSGSGQLNLASPISCIPLPPAAARDGLH